MGFLMEKTQNNHSYISVREWTLHNLHTGHQGIQAMEQTATSTLYWSGIDADIEVFIHRCPACLAIKQHNKWEPLLPHTIPDGPWLKIGIDFFEFDGKKYILVKDFFSQYSVISKMRSMTAEATINKFKYIFVIERPPVTLITDNSPPSNSANLHSSASNGTYSTLQVPQTIHNQMDKLKEQSRELNRKWLDVKKMARTGSWHSYNCELHLWIRTYQPLLKSYMADHMKLLMVRHNITHRYYWCYPIHFRW